MSRSDTAVGGKIEAKYFRPAKGRAAFGGPLFINSCS